MVHSAVEIVQVFVPQKLIIDDVPLSPGVVEGVAITLSGEIKPLERSLIELRKKKPSVTNLWMSELVSDEIEIAFAAESMGDKPVAWTLELDRWDP